MPSPVPSVRMTLRQQLGWSNSREAWTERLAGVALLIAAAATCWYGNALPLAKQLPLWGLLLAGAAFLLRRGWLKLFGPVLFYDLIRTARRPQFIRVRLVYVIFLATVFLVVWGNWSLEQATSLEDVWFGQALSSQKVAEVVAVSFYCFLAFQLVIVFFLTPLYVAPAIVEEKERRTLEFLLATDLRNREIVLSMLVSRVAYLFMVLSAALPILALTQFLGGVDPYLLLAGFAATGLTVVSLASLSILNSVLARKPLEAIVRTYVLMLIYLIVSGSAKLLVVVAPFLGTLPSTDEWASPITLYDVVNWANAGNVGTAVVYVVLGVNLGTPLDALLPDVLGSYACFHMIVILGCTGWAVAQLRGAALREAAGPRRKAAAPGAHPPVGRWPMVWKEVFVEGHTRWGRWARAGIGLLAAASLVPALGIIGVFIFFFLTASWSELSEAMHIWVRIASTGVIGLTLLHVAFRASGTMTSERGRQTLDTLLTTPLSSDAILFAKWLGAVVRPRRAWLWLGTIWSLAYATGGLSLWSVLCLVSAWLVYAAFFASLGLWCSVLSRTSTQAALGTVLALGAVTGGHWLVWKAYSPLLEQRYRHASDELLFWMIVPAVLTLVTMWVLIRSWLTARVALATTLLLILLMGAISLAAATDLLPPLKADGTEELHLYGLTPPATLDWLTFVESERYAEWRHHGEDDPAVPYFVGFGLGLYSLGAYLFWNQARRNFCRLTGRDVKGPAAGPAPFLPAVKQSLQGTSA